MKKNFFILMGILVLSASPGLAASRQFISIVGSSTVYPFAKAVTEEFAKKTGLQIPKLKSTGSGGGLKLFCAGAGPQNPDITNASRSIKKAEYDQCVDNGIKEIVEVQIGYDGIVIANSRHAPLLKLTTKDIFLALAQNVPDGSLEELIPNPYTYWNEVDPALPPLKIKVYGPPPTSGTRDAFEELAMEKGCSSFAWLKALKKRHKSRFLDICHAVREDGRYIDSGENDNLIVDKLEANQHAVGIFGYSYLDQNQDKIQGAYVDLTTPTYKSISSGVYPLSRPLYFYVKKARVGAVHGIRQYLQEFTADATWGPNGYLIGKGLIPMSRQDRLKNRDIAIKLPVMKRW